MGGLLFKPICSFNGWQMQGAAPGPQSQRGVCLHKLISQTKRVYRALPAAPDQNSEPGAAGKGPSVHLAKQDGTWA